MGSGPTSTLIEAMDASEIEKAVVFGVDDNDMVADAAQKYPERLIPFYYFNPRNEDTQLPELEKYAKKGWKGIKVGHEYAVARAMYPMMELAEKYNMVVVIHSGPGNEFHPYIIGDIANSYPKVKTVILHMGGGVALDIELVSTKIAEKNPNLYLETCYSHPYAITQAVKTLGPWRVLFGSDASNDGYASHYEKPGQYQEIHLDAVRLADLTPEEEEIVLGKAAIKLLDLEV
jgi:hypothetical protein